MAAAGGEPSPETQEALSALCQAYWLPVYGKVRDRGFTPHDAQDLTQDFFAHLLERGSIRRADRDRGRFRSYLAGALKYFLADALDHRNAARRGGGVRPISLDDLDVEGKYQSALVARGLSPSEEFDRRWALVLLDRAFERLKAEYAHEDKAAAFEVLKGFLANETGDGEYEAASAQIGLTPQATAVTVCRLRSRFRELVREEVRDTVPCAGDVKGELQLLFGV